MLTTLFSMDGIAFILRYLHFFFGIMWIGHLYYFNFTQGTGMAQMDAGGKSNVTTKLLPVALYWFRWGAMWTLVTGLLLFGIKGHEQGMDVFANSYGITISMGMIMGILMWANVWFIIWPAQQIIMKSANQVAGGGAAIPEAAALGPKALLASRTNTLFSIPLLFFMGAASHLGFAITPESNVNVMWIVMLALIFAVEGNAIKGKLGPMATVKGLITSGFILTAVMLGIMGVLL
jgi:uncharacterized membrane protein